MGFMEIATPLEYEESKPFIAGIKERGTQQFLALWQQHKDRSGDDMTWGDEIEYILVKFRPESVAVSCIAPDVLSKLTTSAMPGCWRTEYGSHMIESVADPPFGS